MSRLTFGIFGVLAAFAVLALSGIGAATASAEVAALLTEKKCETGTEILFCYENNSKPGELFELEGEEEFTILTPSPVTLLSSLEGESVEINCEATDAYRQTNGVTELGGLVKQNSPLAGGGNYTTSSFFLFLGCLLIGTLASKCKIPTEKATVQLSGAPKSAEDLVFHPATGTVFIEIPIQQRSGCPATVIKTAKVTGTQLCTFPSIGTDQTEHLLECGASELKFAENTATFEFDANIEPVHLNERFSITEVG